MKTNNSIIALALCFSASAFTGCGTGALSGLNSSTDGTTGATSSATGTADAASSLLSGVIGSLLNSGKSASIVGTWTYSEPSIEFESSNLLAKAGGSIAANQMVNKLSPYYEKLGIKAGKFTLTFKEDNTCVININGMNQTAKYTYDASAHTLKITGQNLGLSFGTAYATVSSSQLSLTFDSTKLMTLAKSIASASSDTTVKTISSLAGSFDGMKTGFKFVKK